MKKSFTILTLIVFGYSFAQYDNGPLSTGTFAEDRTEAPAGFEFSELQYDDEDEDTNSSAGFSGNLEANYMLSDDFRIPEGEQWTIQSIELFAYATNFADGCPIQSANIFILDHLAGETTNIAVTDYDCTQTNLLRVFNSIDDNALFQDEMMNRIITQVTFPVESVVLEPGYFSLRFQSTTQSGYNHFYPAVTVPGERSIITENAAQQSSDNGMSWLDLVDAGYNGVEALQDLPFVINYSTMGTNDIMSPDNRIKIYPNPVFDDFKIAVPSSFNKQNLKVSIKDLTGRMVKEFNQLNEEGFDISQLPHGIYIITVTDGKNRNTNKLIKK